MSGYVLGGYLATFATLGAYTARMLLRSRQLRRPLSQPEGGHRP